MRELTIIIWLICFPLACSIERYFTQLSREKRGLKDDEYAYKTLSWIQLIVFITVLIALN